DSQDFEGNILAGHRNDAGRVFMAIAVEQTNLIAWAKTANRGQMMSLGTLDRGRANTERTIDVKSIGHPCYNTLLLTVASSLPRLGATAEHGGSSYANSGPAAILGTGSRNPTAIG